MGGLADYIVRVKGREDGGYDFIGPFDTVALAEQWAERFAHTFATSPGMVVSWEIHPMVKPAEEPYRRP